MARTDELATEEVTVATEPGPPEEERRVRSHVPVIGKESRA